MLPIPGNDRKDIEARWGLNAGRRDMLRARNSLYDCEEAASFLRAHTDPFDERFFFEIAQRIGDYPQ